MKQISISDDNSTKDSINPPNLEASFHDFIRLGFEGGYKVRREGGEIRRFSCVLVWLID